MLNALTIDVEDYFHVSAFEHVVPVDRWDSFESRVGRNTERLLELLDASGVRATFFVLGWVAEREPALIRAIAAAGHEVASHGHAHRLIYEQDRRTFRDDLRRARDVIETASGSRILGYRAPSFSITPRSLWALDVLAEEGYAYDASVFPIHHDRYGLPGAPRHPYRLEGQPMAEAPGSTVSFGPITVPVAGGGYFRLFPYRVTRWAIRRLNRREGQPAVVYLHPWEIDPEQPRIAAGLVSRFRHYQNLSRTEPRLRRLLRDFSFAPLADVLRARGLLSGAGVAA